MTLTKEQQEKLNKERERLQQEEKNKKDGQEGGDDKGNESGTEGDGQDDGFVKMKKDEYASFQKTLSDLTKFKEDAEKQKLKDEQDKLIAEGKIEEAYKSQLEELNNKLAEKDKELFSNKKNLLLKELGLADNLSKFIVGDTLEEIEASAKELAETFKKGAPENIVKGKIGSAGTPPSKDENGKKIWTYVEISKLRESKEGLKTYLEKRDEINEQIKKGLVK